MQVGNLVELSARAKKLIFMKSLRCSVGLVERMAGPICYVQWYPKSKNSKNMPVKCKNLKVAK
jgi:hypothetical protein